MDRRRRAGHPSAAAAGEQVTGANSCGNGADPVSTPFLFQGAEMARVTVEDCLPLVDNRFALVLLATKRARQLMAGARPVVQAKDKPPVLALREVATGKVRFDRP